MSTDPALLQQQDPKEINELLHTLQDADRRKPKSGPFTTRKTSFPIERTNYTVDSWKFPEFDFKKGKLPTFARGLFTWRDPVSGNHRIVIRGYDKFFNIDEIQRTKWEWIEEHTRAPYELTMKENGCIIFISGLPDGTLLVCSKHSTGPRQDADQSHAVVGEKWVDKQLAKVGKTRKDLAETLFKANATAVAELCDDSFEEHILAYEGDRAGLYLHGINLNLKQFATYPMEEVHKFADKWAFKKIDYLVKDNVKDLRKFLEEAAETGSWDGKDVEGFVIRSKARYGPDDPTWHDWFFKYKFEEPYLLYRQWRECTKAMLAGRDPRYKKHVEITKEYLQYARHYFNQNKQAIAAYNANHGIIRLRDEFLVHRGIKGSDIIKESAQEEAERNKNLVLVPIATIGCGKTTVAHALVKLFGWGHQQNDNITSQGKGKAKQFATKCAMALADSPVVIADRNNHQKRERQQIFDDMAHLSGVQFVALHYVHYNRDDRGLQKRIREATRERVFSRGDNHQTIQAATRGRSEIEGIMEGFMKRFEPVDPESFPDSTFDLVIDLDPTVDSRENLETVVTELHRKYPHIVKEIPSDEQLDAAIQASFDEYKPEVKHVIGKPSGQKKKGDSPKSDNSPTNNNAPAKQKIEYFSISLPTSSVLSAVTAAFDNLSDERRAFFTKLQTTDRVQKDFHLTLIHGASAKSNPDMWGKYLELYQDKGSEIGKAKVRLDKIVWDGRIMAIAASIVEGNWDCANRNAHVTIGTDNISIKPKEANEMLTNGENYEEVDIPGEVILNGTVIAVKPAGRS